MPRTIESIVENIIYGIERTKTKLTETGIGSVLGALSRSIAVAHLELDNILETTLENIDFNKAKGQNLDKLANTYGVYRKPAYYGKGYALIKTTEYNININNNIQLIDLKTGIRFVLDTPGGIILNPYIEEVVPIKVVDMLDGKEELEPNTRLYILNTDLLNKEIEIVIGRNRLKDGLVCGGLYTGYKEESDEELRDRLLRTIQNLNIITIENLRQRIMQEVDTIPIENVWVNTKAPGFIEVFIRGKESIDEVDLGIIKEYTKSNIPLGVEVIVSESPVVIVDIEISVTAITNQDIGKLDISIKRIIKTYINSLGLGQTFIPTAIQALIKPLVDKVVISIPKTKIDINNYEHIELGEIVIEYRETYA